MLEKTCNKMPLRWFQVPVLLILVAAICHGCISREGYKELTVKNKLVSYHIEYSRFYNRSGPRVNTESTSPACYLTLLAPEKHVELLVPDSKGENLKTVNSTYVPASIEIDTYDPTNNPLSQRNAQERLDGHISGASKWEHFQLFERSPIVISGVNGEVITFVEDWFLPFANSEEPKLRYFRIAGFDYGGYIWIITAQSEMEMSDTIKVDFDHIVQTFKILD